MCSLFSRGPRGQFMQMLVLFYFSASPAWALEPQSGWWWNSSEPGRGYFIEVKNGAVYAASFLYDDSGHPVWYATGPTSYSGTGFSGNLVKHRGGQTLTGAYRPPAGNPMSEGGFSVSFADTTRGTIIWPGGTTPITRYEIAPGSLSSPAATFRPETGWWWNADEGGRGFSIEVQGDQVYIAGFMYDADGSPVWYATGGKMTTPSFFQGTWVQYGNGQSMTGTWKAAGVTNNNLGPALFSFDSPTTGFLQLPDGRQVRLVRFAFSAPQTSSPEVRDTQFGKVVGRLSSTSNSLFWGGIPYAAPPVGSLRWKPPTDPAPWGSISATGFGKACIQQSDVNDGLLGTVEQSEDCLTLNIWRPNTNESNLPVLVYVHGGSNVVGYGGYSYQWGGKLAEEQKVIVVTINYRLNLFGWLYHPALLTGNALSDSGNYGNLDVLQALRFVKTNIANFGGDAGNVTLGGQSAGGVQVWNLMASPLSSGLFHKAMPLSGFLSLSTQAPGEQFTNYLISYLVYYGTGSTLTSQQISDYIAANLASPQQKKNYLYSRTAAQLKQAYIGAGIGVGSSPNTVFRSNMADGTVLPPDLNSAFTGAYLNNVPVLAGITNEEGKYWGYYFAKPGAWRSMQNTPNPDQPTITSIDQIIDSAYLPASKPFTHCGDVGYNALTLNVNYVNTRCANSYFVTSLFWNSAKFSLNKIRPLQGNTYAYNFAWANMPEPFKTVWGAAHVSDLPFLLGNANGVTGGIFRFGYTTANKSGRDALSSKMRNFVASFMRTANPNYDGLGVSWNPWSTSQGGAKFMLLDADNTNAILQMTTSDVPR